LFIANIFGNLMHCSL